MTAVEERYPDPMKPTLAELHKAWFVEAEAIEEDDDDRAVGLAADLPNEVDDVLCDIGLDPDFQAVWYEWDCFIFQRYLRLALERASEDGVLLGSDLRATRLQTCSQPMIDGLKVFLAECPEHVQVALISYNFHVVRSERMKRLGRIKWNPVAAARAATERLRA